MLNLIVLNKLFEKILVNAKTHMAAKLDYELDWQQIHQWINKAQLCV